MPGRLLGALINSYLKSQQVVPKPVLHNIKLQIVSDSFYRRLRVSLQITAHYWRMRFMFPPAPRDLVSVQILVWARVKMIPAMLALV